MAALSAGNIIGERDNRGGGGGGSHRRGAAASALGRFRPGDDEGSPILELNTTPLIDVMLVLLVMLIITVPSQTHKVPLALPGIVELPTSNLLRNLLTLDRAGVARWNGQAVDDTSLAALLRGVATMARPAEVHFEPDAAARYERVDTVLAMASRSGLGTLGFVGNERYRDSF